MGLLSMLVPLLIYTNGAIPGSTIKNYQLKHPCNCVQFTRSINSYLPYGLWNCTSKKRIVNTDDTSAGNTVITREGYACHVATILYETESDIIVIESNYQRCKFTIRQITKDDKAIIGYYKSVL
jgi:hypothetical protein